MRLVARGSCLPKGPDRPPWGTAYAPKGTLNAHMSTSHLSHGGGGRASPGVHADVGGSADPALDRAESLSAHFRFSDSATFLTSSATSTRPVSTSTSYWTCLLYTSHPRGLPGGRGLHLRLLRLAGALPGAHGGRVGRGPRRERDVGHPPPPRRHLRQPPDDARAAPPGIRRQPQAGREMCIRDRR